MTWEILWALVLGFALSAVVQAVVRRATIVRLLGDDRPRTLALAAGFGIASSSCSYAAVALARSLFRKGASFTAAMAFEVASTNLVVELGVILALLMGWQFTLAQFTGGPVMIVILAVLFRAYLGKRLLGAAEEQAGKGLAGAMEGHAAMDMSVQRDGSFASRLLSRDGFAAVANVFVMEWAAIIRDLVAGLLVAGAIAAWVPDSFWRTFFFAGHPFAAKAWGPLIGPVVAIISFVCSIGNVPLAVVLWQGGISFGGVVAFVFADLIIAPILNIYRKYYGARMALFLLGTFYVAMAAAGYAVELVFGGLGLIPRATAAKVLDDHPSWNYTTWLNIAFLALAAVLVTQFVRSGGLGMLRMMGGPADRHDMTDHEHLTGEAGMDDQRARALLEAERAEVLDLIQGTETDVQEDRDSAGVTGDHADTAQPIESEEEDDAIAESLQNRLGALDRALARLDNGTYGRSIRSGVPIPDERLEADPAAELTVEEASRS